MGAEGGGAALHMAVAYPNPNPNPNQETGWAHGCGMAYTSTQQRTSGLALAAACTSAVIASRSYSPAMASATDCLKSRPSACAVDPA